MRSCAVKAMHRIHRCGSVEETAMQRSAAVYGEQGYGESIEVAKIHECCSFICFQAH